jgi:hypothetical protein
MAKSFDVAAQLLSVSRLAGVQLRFHSISNKVLLGVTGFTDDDLLSLGKESTPNIVPVAI